MSSSGEFDKEWVPLYLPANVLRALNETSLRAGVTRTQAVQTAIWIFQRALTMSERASFIAQFLSEVQDEFEENVE